MVANTLVLSLPRQMSKVLIVSVAHGLATQGFHRRLLSPRLVSYSIPHSRSCNRFVSSATVSHLTKLSFVSRIISALPTLSMSIIGAQESRLSAHFEPQRVPYLQPVFWIYHAWQSLVQQPHILYLPKRRLWEYLHDSLLVPREQSGGQMRALEIPYIRSTQIPSKYRQQGPLYLSDKPTPNTGIFRYLSCSIQTCHFLYQVNLVAILPGVIKARFVGQC